MLESLYEPNEVHIYFCRAEHHDFVIYMQVLIRVHGKFGLYPHPGFFYSVVCLVF